VTPPTLPPEPSGHLIKESYSIPSRLFLFFFSFLKAMTANAIHVLDDFLECTTALYLICVAIETVPSEIRSQFEMLAAKDVQYEEARKALFKKRNLYLRAEEKGLDSTLQHALLKKTEKEHAKLLAIIDEKIDIENKLVSVVESHLGRLESELTGKLGMPIDNPFASIFADIPDAEQRVDRMGLNNRCRSSPKRRQTLTDEPIDPNEPVYCYCRQVSYGDMIGCDNDSVSVHSLSNLVFSVRWNGSIISVLD
jgi:hypothetical protein